jgi:transcription initiation factor TFIID subunit TAF12
VNEIDKWLEITGMTLRVSKSDTRATVSLPPHTPGESTTLKVYKHDGNRAMKVTLVAPATAATEEEATVKLFKSIKGFQVTTARGNFNTPWIVLH